MSKDILQRFLFENAPVRGEYIHLHTSLQTILLQHHYPAPVRRLLSEALCVVGLLSAIIKFDGRLTVQFRGKSKLKYLLAQCDNHFNLRGLAKWEGDLSYEELMTAMEEGVLAVMIDSGKSQNRYQGIVSWKGGSLAQSIEEYFLQSEQLPTRIWLEVNDAHAVGYLLQVVPEHEKDRTFDDEKKKEWKRIVKTTEFINSMDILSISQVELLNKLYPNEEIRLFDEKQVAFRCTCSRERSDNAIKLLGQQEAEAELRTKNSIVVTCEFCNQEYVYDSKDVKTLFAIDDPSGDQTLN